MDTELEATIRISEEETIKTIRRHENELRRLKGNILKTRLYLHEEIRMQEINLHRFKKLSEEDKDEDMKMYGIIRLMTTRDELAWLKFQLAKAEKCILDDTQLFRAKSHRYHLEGNYLKGLRFVYEDKVVLHENTLYTRDVEAGGRLALFLSYAEHAPFVITPRNERKHANLKRYLSSLEEDYFEFGNTYSRLANYDEAEHGYIIVEGIENEIQLSLYFSALMQIDPLAKLVFLFRIIENEFQNKTDDEKWKKTTKLRKQKNIPCNDYPKYVEYLYGLAKKCKLRPLWVERCSKKETIRFNIITKWKRKKYEGLGTKSYNWGRCGLAHGKEGMILHDFGDSLDEINNINIALTLVSRFIIERNNPSLKRGISVKSCYSRIKHEIYGSIPEKN